MAQTMYLIISTTAIIVGGLYTALGGAFATPRQVEAMVQKEKKIILDEVRDKHQSVSKVLERIDSRVWEIYKKTR